MTADDLDLTIDRFAESVQKSLAVSGRLLPMVLVVDDTGMSVPPTPLGWERYEEGLLVHVRGTGEWAARRGQGAVLFTRVDTMPEGDALVVVIEGACQAAAWRRIYEIVRAGQDMRLGPELARRESDLFAGLPWTRVRSRGCRRLCVAAIAGVVALAIVNSTGWDAVGSMINADEILESLV